MGLTVKLHTGLTETDINDYTFSAYVIDKDWKHYIKNLTYDGYYKAEKSEMLFEYPCSYHNSFRRELCMIIGKDKDAWFCDYSEWDNTLPFSKFFQFADNDGCLDWETCYELYRDFYNYQAIAKEKLNKTYYETYSWWLKAFKKASVKLGVIQYS